MKGKAIAALLRLLVLVNCRLFNVFRQNIFIVFIHKVKCIIISAIVAGCSQITFIAFLGISFHRMKAC
jgi:hypothetical protein